MSLDQERTEILIGEDGIKRLANKHVMVVGLGGVGGYAAEAVARAGIGKITIVDYDLVASSNCNRQLPALQSTIGKPKTEVMGQRLLDINPGLNLEVMDNFLNPDNISEILHHSSIDYLLDCIDSIACKADLVATCQNEGIPVASAMGAGGRVDVTRAKISTLKKTMMCPLAREMRGQMRKLGASLDYPVVFSDETPVKGLPHQPIDSHNPGRPRAVNGTISYLPGLFGMMLAGHMIQKLIESDND
ncbi:MAG: tRNA threonylcarbamoyladenosine dehydratase [Gammaproteobacteria bacterium]|nr:tRNA threonylcarbamoyladenosine dehydratase [Gammaproteobacteria bacterium]